MFLRIEIRIFILQCFAGDIISTVATTPQIGSVLVLGAIVLIRTFLGLSIEVEIEGKLPWKKRIRARIENSFLKE